MSRNWKGFTFYENAEKYPEWEGDRIEVHRPANHSDNWLCFSHREPRFLKMYSTDEIKRHWSEAMHAAKQVKQHDAEADEHNHSDAFPPIDIYQWLNDRDDHGDSGDSEWWSLS